MQITSLRKNQSGSALCLTVLRAESSGVCVSDKEKSTDSFLTSIYEIPEITGMMRENSKSFFWQVVDLII
jgi:hypothetical protein